MKKSHHFVILYTRYYFNHHISRITQTLIIQSKCMHNIIYLNFSPGPKKIIQNLIVYLSVTTRHPFVNRSPNNLNFRNPENIQRIFRCPNNLIHILQIRRYTNNCRFLIVNIIFFSQIIYILFN